MGITESEIRTASDHYKKVDGIDIGYLDFGQQKTLVNAYLHGASMAIEILLDEARVREKQFLEEDNS